MMLATRLLVRRITHEALSFDISCGQAILDLYIYKGHIDHTLDALLT